MPSINAEKLEQEQKQENAVRERRWEIVGGALAVTMFYYINFPDSPTDDGESLGTSTRVFNSLLATLGMATFAGIIALVSRLLTYSWHIVFAVVVGILLSLDLLVMILKLLGYMK